MAKKNKAPPIKKTRVVPRKSGATLSLSDAGVRYAKLLADPCNGDLVNGPFGDGQGGMVARFEREYMVNVTATDANAFLAYVPSTGAVYISSVALPTDTTPFTMIPMAPNGWPGYTFLQPNSSHIRPLAACVQVYWPGSELNRQGVVSLGRHNAEVFNDTLDVSSLRAQANYIKRMPADCFEMLWRPTESDTIGREWIPAPSVFSGTTAIVFTATGIPVSTGVRIRVVGVFEWMPDPTSGFKNVIVRNPSPHRLADILAFLDRTGDWMSGTAHAAGRAVSSLAAGVGSIMSLGNGVNRIGRALLA